MSEIYTQTFGLPTVAKKYVFGQDSQHWKMYQEKLVSINHIDDHNNKDIWYMQLQGTIDAIDQVIAKIKEILDMEKNRNEENLTMDVWATMTEWVDLGAFLDNEATKKFENMKLEDMANQPLEIIMKFISNPEISPPNEKDKSDDHVQVIDPHHGTRSKKFSKRDDRKKMSKNFKRARKSIARGSTRATPIANQ